MTKIRVKEVTGPQGATEADGIRLRDTIMPLLKSREVFELDFEGIELASSTFFNAAFGLVFSEYGANFVRHNMTLSNMKPRIQFVWDRTLRSYATAV